MPSTPSSTASHGQPWNHMGSEDEWHRMMLQVIGENVQCAVCVGQDIDMGEWFTSSIGTRQGDPLSPTTFITYLGGWWMDYGTMARVSPYTDTNWTTKIRRWQWSDRRATRYATRKHQHLKCGRRDGLTDDKHQQNQDTADVIRDEMLQANTTHQMATYDNEWGSTEKNEMPTKFPSDGDEEKVELVWIHNAEWTTQGW